MRIALIAISVALLPCAEPARPITTRGPFRGYLARIRTDVTTDSVASLARNRLGPDWGFEPTGLPNTVMMHPGITAQTNAPTSTAAAVGAWEMSHALRGTGLFEWIEPAFAGPMTVLQAAAPIPSPGECEGNWQPDWGKFEVDPEAAKDSQWSLGPAGANVVEAWNQFPAGQWPGHGVTIGHPDTGYSSHPAISDALLGKGFSFVERRTGAVDLTMAGKLQWPGHGTRTSSVIAGKREFRVDPNGKYPISGVAYGAKVIPLRVTNRVLLFQLLDLDMVNLALAIQAASIGDPNFVPRKVDVISMSLGGAPSRAMVDALETARRHNVIVLAAAGNEVPLRQVGFPARYEGVLAIAAVNARSTPWPGSSKGSSVAFSAPGENVWTAKEFIERDESRKEDVPHHCVQMGTGTSYAVATSAGVAALWLSKHRAALRDNQDLAATFRRSARDTVRKPQSWDTDYGPGIVDAGKLLVQSPPHLAVAQLTTCPELQALQSVFGDRHPGAAAALVAGSSRDAACVTGSGIADEIAHWFSTNATTLAAFQTFFESGDQPGAMEALRQDLLRGPLAAYSRRALRRVSGFTEGIDHSIGAGAW
jgi:thermitase